MELFEKDIFEGKLSKYETNHFHMVIDGNFELPIDSMKMMIMVLLFMSTFIICSI